MESPVKWLTQSQYSNLPIDHRAIAQADSQVGIRESETNRGTRVTEYQRTAGLGNSGGYPWCACFVYWCLIQAGASPFAIPDLGKCAAVRNWKSWAKARGRTKPGASRGRLFYWLDSNQTGHIGFCLGPSVFGVFRTIEGNTDSGSGAREGDGVYKRTRTIWQLRRHKESGFIDLSNV